MSKDLHILRLKDDLEQAGKEIEHLQSIVDNLLNDQKAQNAAISHITIENNALRMECDDLRNVIQIADDGIADINTHWKQKFFIWRETESQLLKELAESKDKIHELSSEFETKIQKQLQAYDKLKSLTASSKDDNEKLIQSLEKAEEDVKNVTRKLMEESRKNIQHMFLSSENEILNEKIGVLETKVHSFYEESMRHSREVNQEGVRQEAERDFNITHQQNEVSHLNVEITNLKSELHSRNNEVKNLKDEVSRLSCLCESQTSRIKQLRKQSESSNDSVAASALILQKEREKLKKVNEVINYLNQKIVTLKKINEDLKTEIDLKYGLLREKDAQIQHYKTCCSELETKFNHSVSEVDNYKHTLNLAESEKLVVKRDLESWIEKYSALKMNLDEVSAESMQLVEELDSCNSKIALLSKQYKNAEMENSNTDRAYVQCQQKAIDLEVELTDRDLRLDELTRENLILNTELTSMLEDIKRNKNVIASKEIENKGLYSKINVLKENNSAEISALQEQLHDKSTRYLEYKAEMEEKLNKLIHLTEYSDKSTSNVSLNSTFLVNCGTMTELDSSHSVDCDRYKKQIAMLKKEMASKERKMCHAETELAKQASTIVQNECQIDQLSVKCASMRSKQTQKQDNHLLMQVNRLNEQVNSLKEVIASKDNKLWELQAAASEFKKREQTFWELSELVNTLQNELDSKHSNILREVNFYKGRLMEYERRTPSVNKSVNTSLQEESSDVDVDLISCKSGEDKQIDLQDLENVMNNLKSNYKNDLDAIHASFRDKLSEIGDCSEQNELKWIDLMNK